MAAAVQTRASEVSGGNEFAFTDHDFRQIAAMLYADSGISLPETKSTLVYSRLAKRLRALGLESFRQYCELISGPDGTDERHHMLVALTTNVTRFFREPHHFDHLRENVLPPAIEAAKRGGRLRLWSAGCSTGQEPYSIALTLLSVLPNAGDYDIRILASDIDPSVIATARRGIYSESEVASIPADLRRRFLEPAGDGRGLSIGDDARALVAFRELNLIGSWPMKHAFQAIFCRNVVIYFDDETQQKTWRRFQEHLAPGGQLYVGHSERVGVTGFVSSGLTSYQFTGQPR
ncbi:MAG: protein-glutamate O-methyltransferase [Methylobacteriaceae bacterium]|nr:protein-glutamate O-methyltransferase [Methylobacteriaceae bacterium]